MTVWKLSAGLIVACVLAGGSYAADPDKPMHKATPSDHQMLKDCIRKHQTDDVNLSKAELNRVCKDEIKQKKAGDNPPPPADSPTKP